MVEFRANQYHPPLHWGNVTMFGGAGKRSTEYKLAKKPVVQAALGAHATAAAGRARALLAAHRDTGAASIDVVHPPKTDVDWHVVLSDERGDWAAAAIEYGRGSSRGDGGAAGLYILHQAFAMHEGRRG